MAMSLRYGSGEEVSREYIRHPVDIPIDVEMLKECPEADADEFRLNNVSMGGLSFKTSLRFSPGRRVLIAINSVKPAFSVQCTVQWCKKVEPGFEVGVEFASHEDAFHVRMVEQVCYIENYREQVLRHEGRTLTSEMAADEWIARHAGSFPNPDENFAPNRNLNSIDLNNASDIDNKGKDI